MTSQDFLIQMKDSIYVHNSPIRQYAEAKKTILDKYQSENLSKLLIKKITGVKNIGIKEKESFFNFYGGAQKKGLVRAEIEKEIKQINLRTASEKTNQQSKYDNIYHAIEGIKNNQLPAIQEVNNWLEEILQLFQGSNLYEIAEGVVLQDIIDFSISPIKINEWYEKIKQNILSSLSNNGCIVMKSTSKEFNSYSNVILLVHAFSEHLKNKIKEGTILDGEGEILSIYARYIVGRLTSIIGTAYQPIVASLIEDGKNDIIKTLVETGSEKVKLTHTYEGEKEKKYTSTTSTQDIKIILKDISKLEKELSVELKVPDIGASLKYSGGLRSTRKTGIIKIKDGSTNLGTLLHNLDNQYLSYIYNTIANYNRTNIRIHRKRVANPITFKDYTEMWQSLKVILLINGMIGQMTKNDFSYYFIVSNRVYTVVDIINSILTGNLLNYNGVLTKFGIEMSQVPQLKPSQLSIAKNHIFETEKEDPWSNAFLRSKKVVSNIQNAKVAAGIRMRITEL